MRRRLAAASVLGTAALGLVGLSGPALATTGTAATPLVAKGTGGFQTQKIDVSKPSSTYALVTYKSVAKGIDISQVVFRGVMTGKGCVVATLYKNGEATRNTPKACYKKGAVVTATWTGFGFRPIGTAFQVAFTGTGHPQGSEAFRVTAQ